MKSKIELTILIFFLISCRGITAYAQDKISVSDIKGMWISSLFYNEIKGDYEVIPREDSVGFGFTEGKGKLNQARYTGLYGIIDGGRPKLLYYSLENNKVQFYDSSDNPLSYFLVIESVIPKVFMTATLFQENGDKTIGSKMKFLYYEKKK
jgi:hypothetical protein